MENYKYHNFVGGVITFDGVKLTMKGLDVKVECINEQICQS